MRIAIDAGVIDTDKIPPKVHAGVHLFVWLRTRARYAALTVLGALRCRSRVIRKTANGNDVLRLVARCVWGSRGCADDEWLNGRMKKK